MPRFAFSARALGLAFAPVLLTPTFALAAEDAAQNLLRIVEASKTTNYEGVVVYRGNDRMEVLKVQHRFRDGSERERVTSLNGEQRQIIRIDNRLIFIQPKGETVSHNRPSLKSALDQLTAERVKTLAQWYDFKDEGSGRIADRAAGSVAIVPKDNFRLGYEIWYDQETHIPLKISLVSEHGEVVEQGMLTQVTFPQTIPDEVFESEVDTSKFNLVTQNVPSLAAGADLGSPQVTFEQLPPGYQLVAREVKPLPNGQTGQVEHLLLSDGLSSVSVFSAIVQPDQPGAFRGISHSGSMQAYGRNTGSYHITIVGEVPTAAIRLIGDGAHPVLTPPPGTTPVPAPAP